MIAPVPPIRGCHFNPAPPAPGTGSQPRARRSRSLLTAVIPFAVATAGLLATTVSAQTSLSDGHVDFGMSYESAAWNLHVHDETTGIEFTPSEAVLVLGENLLTSIPTNTKFSFLGAAGRPVYLLPSAPLPNQLYLGFGSEELSATEWNGNLSIQLVAIHGPGDFYAWDLDAFGNVRVRFNSHDGLGPEDVFSQIPGGHSHLNFAFDKPGIYQLTFEVTGNHTRDGISRGDGTYSLVVGSVAEPGIGALLLFGSAIGVSWTAGRPSVRRPVR